MGLLFPSIYEEPLPYAVVESCLLGTLPVTAKVSGVLEIVDTTYAEKLLFRPGDTGGLAEKVEHVLTSSREEFMNISAELREKAREKLDAMSIRGRLLRVFLSLVEG